MILTDVSLIYALHNTSADQTMGILLLLPSMITLLDNRDPKIRYGEVLLRRL